MFYKAEPYRDNYDNLFPSQNATQALYLLQIFEIPYLLMIGDPKTLFYVNAFAILLFSSLMVVMADGYFFPKRTKKWHSIGYFLPVAIIVAYLLLAAVEVIPTTQTTYQVMFWITTAAFVCYVTRLVVLKQKIRRSIRAIDEGRYSNADDFPVRYAKRIEWLPIAICALMYCCFVLNDPMVKMWRDMLFTIVNVWFLIYNLNPHRKGGKAEEEREQDLELALIETGNITSRYKLSEQRCKEIELKLLGLIETESLFRDSHLTLDQLSQKLGINRSYVSEILSRSKYGSFYTLINSYRLAYAQQKLRQDPKLKIEHVAFDSGFSSVSLFSQVFKRYNDITPGEFAKTVLRDSAKIKNVS